jgi:ribosomal-protein-serine acetyltransferase
MLGIRVDDEIFLRLHEERQADELFRLVEQNRDHLRPWMPWVDATRSPDDIRAYLRGTLQSLADGKVYGFVILDRGEMVGSTDLRVTVEAKEGEVGYWIAESAQGRGIVTRTTQALVRFAFDELGMNRFVIRCAVDNVRSCAVPERLGFTLEGTYRQRDLIPDRPARDQHVYALLRSEWQSSAS